MSNRSEHNGTGKWVDDGEEWLTLAQRAERRRLAGAAEGRQIRRLWADDAPPAGAHYSNKTGHEAHGEYAKDGRTRRRYFELHEEPLESLGAPVDGAVDDAIDAQTAPEADTQSTDNQRPRINRDKRSVRPPSNRRR